MAESDKVLGSIPKPYDTLMVLIFEAHAADLAELSPPRPPGGA